jgi:hypothetical protein
MLQVGKTRQMEEHMKMRLGMIYVCYVNGKINDLYYPDRPPRMSTPGFHAQALLEVRNGQVIPSFSGEGFFHRSMESKGLSGEEVLQHLASDTEIKAFFKKWTEDFRILTIEEWIKRLPHYKVLMEEEKNRLTCLAKDFIAQSGVE